MQAPLARDQSWCRGPADRQGCGRSFERGHEIAAERAPGTQAGQPRAPSITMTSAVSTGDLAAPARRRVSRIGGHAASLPKHMRFATTRRASLRLAAISIALAACRNDAPARRPAFHGAEIAPPKAKPDFTLLTTADAPFHFREATSGRLVLLYFGYTSCPDVCPVQMAVLTSAWRRLSFDDQRGIDVVFVTVDPEHDTPDRLRAWVDNFDHRIIALRGSVDEVNRIQQSLGLPPSAAEGNATDGSPRVGHFSPILAFTPDDSLRVLYPFGTRADDWATDLPRLLAVHGGRPRSAAPGALAINGVVAAAPASVGTLADETMAVYLTIIGPPTGDTLLGARSAAARSATIHMMDGGGSMTGMASTPLVIPAGGRVRFAPGGLHVMLTGLTRHFVPGDTLSLTLSFRSAGDVTATARVVSYEQLQRALDEPDPRLTQPRP